MILVHVLGADGDGWGENVAGIDPLYSAEFTDASLLVLRDHLVPRLLAAGDVGGRGGRRCWRPVKGWSMAKCAVEAAVLDAELRAAGTSLQPPTSAARSGRIPAGVSVGLFDTIDETVAAVDAYLADGYRAGQAQDRARPRRRPRRPPCAHHVGPDVLLQVDANCAYTLGDARHLARLDEFDLLLIEQPLAEDDLRQHAAAGPAAAHAALPRREHHVGAVPRPTPSPSAPAPSSTSSPAASAATSRRAASTTSAPPTACPCGAAGCWRRASGGPPTWRWPRCRASPCRPTCRRRTATSAAT